MCGGPDQSKATSSSPSPTENQTNTKDMNNPAVETEDSFSNLLEFAANNDIEGFKEAVDCDNSPFNKVGLWYGRKKGSNQMVLEQKTPLMIAATYGSIDVLKFILDQPEADVNLSCGPDKITALHCAASGGSLNAPDVANLLLLAGADPNCVDANGHRPADVIAITPKFPNLKDSLEALLISNGSEGSSVDGQNLPTLMNNSNFGSVIRSSSPDSGSPSSPLDSVSSPSSLKFYEISANSVSEKKEYPIDPSLPDIKNSIYTTDEFRMFSFKVRPCSRAYSHDWTECPFVHPGENARRRDPRKYHYSCVPCPDFRKGACRRGDMCEYAHGVFECWLHPAQYRTRLCKDGINCDRRVCFFAHLPEELRPLYVSTGTAVPSPRSSTAAANAMDMSAAMNLFPGSPSSVSAMSPSPFAQSLSPSANNGISNSSMGWPQPNVPTLHLPGSNFQSSRLRSSLNARDIPPENFNLLSDFDAHQQFLNEFASYSQHRSGSPSLNRSGRNILAPSNLEELFSAEISSSPRYSDQSVAGAVFSPSHRSALLNQFQQQQSMLSPINTSVFSPKNVEHPLFQPSYGAPSPGRMSPRSVDPISPMGSRLSAFGQREKQQFQQLRSLSARDLGSNNNNSSSSIVGSPVNSWTKWGSPSGKLDWSVNGDELSHTNMQRKSSFEAVGHSGEPDLSWVQSLVKESPPEMKEKFAVPSISGTAVSATGENLNNSNSQVESSSIDHSVLGAWLEQIQLDQLAA